MKSRFYFSYPSSVVPHSSTDPIEKKPLTDFFTQNTQAELGLQLVMERTKSISFNKDKHYRSFEGVTVVQYFNWF